MSLLNMVKNVFLIFLQESQFGNLTLALAKAVAIEMSHEKFMKNTRLQYELVEVN